MLLEAQIARNIHVNPINSLFFILFFNYTPSKAENRLVIEGIDGTPPMLIK